RCNIWMLRTKHSFGSLQRPFAGNPCSGEVALVPKEVDGMIQAGRSTRAIAGEASGCKGRSLLEKQMRRGVVTLFKKNPEQIPQLLRQSMRTKFSLNIRSDG